MNNLIEIANYYINEELYWTSLLIGQYLPKSNKSYFIVIKSLYGLGFYKKIQHIIEGNKNLLNYHEIKMLYLKSGHKTSIESIEHIDLSNKGSFDISRKSLELYYQAYFAKEKLRKKLFIDSFRKDNNNLEALIYLFKESSCTLNEIKHYVEQIKIKELKDAMNCLINCEFDLENICNPLIIFSYSLKIIFSSQEVPSRTMFNKLFKISSQNMDFFINSEFIYSSLGLYYIYKNKFKEASNYLLKAVRKNKMYGIGHLYLGLSHSLLKETESALISLNNAYYIMDVSYLPSYYLAYEYQVMNNIGKATYFYKQSLGLIETECLNLYDSETDYIVKIPVRDESVQDHAEHLQLEKSTVKKLKSYRENNDISKLDQKSFHVICGFIYFLMYNEEYDKAVKYLDLFKIENHLNVFLFLFNGNLTDANDSLDKCKKDVINFAVKGYLYHLVDQFNEAIKQYEICMTFRRNQVVENLMAMSIDNLAGVNPNKAFNYSTALFETLKYKNRIIF